jgi:hypothetical protein
VNHHTPSATVTPTATRQVLAYTQRVAIMPTGRSDEGQSARLPAEDGLMQCGVGQLGVREARIVGAW